MWQIKTYHFTANSNLLYRVRGDLASAVPPVAIKFANEAVRKA